MYGVVAFAVQMLHADNAQLAVDPDAERAPLVISTGSRQMGKMAQRRSIAGAKKPIKAAVKRACARGAAAGPNPR